ncbi:hypothetical protein [Halorussus aquaticus]|uniref:AIPR protein n=1 Tax=Halorussus aquaticus TaxID=2953748 RepID=A0ABD5Q7E1_9EURY|nr:hypothetical protein [Halorussus aquaticus]
MSSRYFLWEGASIPEKRRRLNLEDFRNTDNRVIQELIENTEVVESDFTGNSKTDLIDVLRDKLEKDRRDAFYEDLFDELGQKGSTANLQFYNAAGLEYNSLVESLEEIVRDDDPEEVDSRTISERVFEYETYDGDNIVDILFVLSDIETVDTENAENIDKDDISDRRIRFRDQIDVECRVYLDKGAIAITQSGTDKGERNRIRTLVQTWADGTISTSMELGENELLSLQNLMDGKNCGLGFGDFRNANLTSAKYRGDRTEALARTGIVSPAQDEGVINQVKFYTEYTGSTKARDVQVRAYRDGHVTTSRPTEPDFADTVVEHLLTILEYKENLQRVESLIEEFIDELFQKMILDGSDSYKSRKTQAMENIVHEFFEVENPSFQEVEVQAYRSVIANAGKVLLKIEIDQGLDSDSYPSVSNIDDSPDFLSEVSGFFDDMAEFKLEQPNYDFDRLWNHLHAVLNEEHDSPISVLRSIENKYRA